MKADDNIILSYREESFYSQVDSIISGGCLCLPASTQQKRPTGYSWKNYTQPIPIEEFSNLKPSLNACCIVTGSKSRNIEVLDFDKKCDEETFLKIFNNYKEQVGMEYPGLVDRLPIEETQSGGRHIFFRCTETVIPGNQKLARLDKTNTLIETRGEGGLVVCWPSPGYKLIQGVLSSIPNITASERNTLITKAKMFNQYIESKDILGCGPKPINGDLRPGDDYNQRGDIADLLTKHGWRLVQASEKYKHFCRPEKEQGTSASLIDNNVFYVFSSSTQFETEKGYCPFGVFAILEHDGDYKEAAKALAAMGYGNDHALQVTESNTDAIQKRAKEILSEREPCGPFDLSVLPPLIKEYTEQLCEETEADPVLILTAILAMISTMIGKQIYIPSGEYFNRLYANIWMTVISGSGSFKTTAMNKGCRLLWQREGEIREQIGKYNDQLKQIGIDLSGNDKDKKKKQIKRDIDELAKQSIVLPNRMTGEALLEVLSTGQGGLIPASELGEWLDNLEKHHNQGLKPLFTDLYDVPQQYIYRTRTGGQMLIERPFISIFGVSTMSWVQKNISLSDIGSGFFARFLLFYPPQKNCIPPALPVAKKMFDTNIEEQIKERLASMPPNNEMYLEEEAKSFFNSVHYGIYEAMTQCNQRDRELLDPYLKRWSPYVLKLAILLQVCISKSNYICVDAIKAATAVVEYSIKSTVNLFQGELGESPFQIQCRKVLNYIAKKEGKITRKKLTSSKVLPGGSKEYDEVLTLLSEQGQIDILKGGSSQRKDEVIQLSQP